MMKILGGDGATLRSVLLRFAAEDGKRLVIVPEQYTLQTERDLIDGLQAKGFFDLEVLSPSRLTERVFALAGTDERVRVDARGKQIALARALMLCKKQLRYYESAAERQGFIQRAGMLIADFKRAEVEPEALLAHAEALPEGAEQDKLHDLALIYAQYERQLAGQFVDGEDVQAQMLLRLPESGLTRDALVIVFGFDVMTGQMCRLLQVMAAESREVLVLLNMRDTPDFEPVRESARRLRDGALAAGLACETTWLPEMPSAQAQDIAFLSRHYLSPGGAVFFGTLQNIRLYAAPNPYYEAHFVAQEILLLHERGMAFGDIAVAMGDEGFAGTLSTVLASYAIPAYAATKLSATSHGAARFLIASLRAVGGGYAAQDMLGVIKSGYAPIADADAWRLENYLLSYGIRGRLWLAPFARGGAEERAQVEAARMALIEPLEALRQALSSSADAGETLRRVYDYLDQTGLFARLTAQQERLLRADMPAEAAQTRQIWDAMMRLLSQAYALLHDVKVSARQLSAWLEAGLSGCELSALPPTADAVMCGGLGTLPLAHPRALFLTNMTDTLLSPGAPSLLTQEEQERAQRALHAYLSLTEDGQDDLRRLDVWKAMSAPAEKLFLTRAQAMQDGGALRPFSGLGTLRRLFPALIEEGGVSQCAAAALPLAPGPALDEIGGMARRNALQGDWLSAWRYLSRDPQTRERAQALRDAFAPETDAPPLPRPVTHALFMERVMSVSRLESFAACPYRHFVEQGLSPRPRKEWTVTPIDAGNFYHSALEGFTRLLPTIPGWPRIDKKTCDAAIDAAAQPIMTQMLSGAMGDSARMRALGDKYTRVLRRVAWTFTRGARQSAFSPVCAEVRFGYPGGIPPLTLTLKTGERVYVRGVIDRIDRYAGDEGVYLRVVDYKSGAEKLDPARIFYGAQLQLLLYLQAALAMEDDAAPAGAFYMRLSDPILPDQADEKQLEDALARALCLRGVALRDVEILRRMDEGTPPLTLPKVTTADGGFDQRAMLATLEEMRALIAHAKDMAARLTERMREGEIAARPLCDGEKSGPCEHCDYADICRRSVSRAPDNARLMQRLRFDELLEKLNQNRAGNSDINQV